MTCSPTYGGHHRLPTCIISPQLFAHGEVSAIGMAAEEGMEGGTVVVMYRVAKLMQNDVVDKMVGKAHKMKAQREIVTCRATAPLAYGVTNRDTAVTKAMLMGEMRYAARQEFVRFDTPCLFDASFYGALYGLAFGREFRWMGDKDSPVGYSYTYTGRFGAA